MVASPAQRAHQKTIVGPSLPGRFDGEFAIGPVLVAGVAEPLDRTGAKSRSEVRGSRIEVSHPQFRHEPQGFCMPDAAVGGDHAAAIERGAKGGRRDDGSRKENGEAAHAGRLTPGRTPPPVPDRSTPPLVGSNGGR